MDQYRYSIFSDTCLIRLNCNFAGITKCCKESLGILENISDFFRFRYNKYFSFSAWRNIHACTGISDTADSFLDQLNGFLILFKVPFILVFRPLGDHNGFFFILNIAENLFCDERHIRMKQLQCIDQDCLQCPEGCCLCLVFVIVKSWLHHFNVPVAEFFPDEIINLGYGNTQFILIDVLCDILRQTVHLGKNPLVSLCQICQ